MFSDPEQANLVLFKQTFMFVCQQLFWYRYRESPQQREETAACALCEGLERERRRASEAKVAMAESARGAASQHSSRASRGAVAVVFCAMSRREAHELRRAARETWAQLLQGAAALRFFVGRGPYPLKDDSPAS
eukprot:TRINITY_DN68603_c0_g1_i1.p1 TRINITY_DN68603_c0_g1~~TRINITY_DN68603_c0_g1_i1.p1  ORF type:complete len:153 (+),score=35.42 TRINITY_DN68603_c0_g1_i1:59-460(+)